jgi:hypothetical protein
MMTTLALAASNAVTWPYYRFYRQNTLLPILAITRSVRDMDDPGRIAQKFRHWQDRKLNEFQFVQVSVSWSPKGFVELNFIWD